VFESCSEVLNLESGIAELFIERGCRESEWLIGLSLMVVGDAGEDFRIGVRSFRKQELTQSEWARQGRYREGAVEGIMKQAMEVVEASGMNRKIPVSGGDGT